MKQRRQWYRRVLAAVVVAAGVMGVAQAQPDPNNAPKGNNPPNQPQRPNWPNRDAWQKMTPEERQKMMDQMRDTMWRNRLNGAGFTDTKMQDAIIAYSKAQEKELQPVRDAGQKLIEALRDKASSDADIAALLNDFRAEAETLKAQRKTELAELDAKINYTKNPRLDAFLTMMGLIGDETALLGGGRGMAWAVSAVLVVAAPAVDHAVAMVRVAAMVRAMGVMAAIGPTTITAIDRARRPSPV